jgi:hypothetical protein
MKEMEEARTRRKKMNGTDHTTGVIVQKATISTGTTVRTLATGWTIERSEFESR